MKSYKSRITFLIYLFFLGLIGTLVLYRPGIYYYLKYDKNPEYIEFQKYYYHPMVVNGVINFGHEFTYGTGMTIWADNRFSLFGYDNLDKYLYKTSDKEIVICNSKWLGNCIFSEGEGVQSFQQFLTK